MVFNGIVCNITLKILLELSLDLFSACWRKKFTLFITMIIQLSTSHLSKLTVVFL